MIPILFVGDGERDGVTVPRLVERILGRRVREDFRRWARLRGGSGYERKLAFAVRQAKDAGTQGVVAAIDKDKSQGRLRALREQRDLEQTHGAFPIAVAEAVPHSEAWLLDDPVAVRECLGLASDVEIPTVRQVKSAKEALEALRARGTKRDEPLLTIWAEVARNVSLERCAHAKETGFDGLVSEVTQQFREVASGR